MDEVLPGLWVGDLACALSTEYLSLAGVTHIVTALKQRLPPPPLLPCGRRILAEHQRHVSIDDEESEPILVQFPAVNDFLEEVLQERWVEGQQGAPLDEQRSSDGKWGHWETTGEGTVLVHCQAGCSRSVALVVAYIMATRKCSRDAALSMVRARRAQAEPNSGFMEQLSLFEQAGYQVDLRHAPIRRFLMSKVDVLNGGSVEDILMSYFPSPAHSPSGSMSGSTLGGRSRRNSSSSSGPHGLNLAPLSSIDGDVDDSTSSVESPRRPMIRRRSRSTVGEGTVRDSKTGKLADLSISPPMPGNTDALFAADAEASPPTGTSSSSWATSITSPHEVLIARSRGFRLPGGVPSIRGHESRSGSGSLPKPDYLRGTPRLRCKMCRREIAARDHIVEHEPGKGIMAFDVKNRRKEMRGPKAAEEVGGSGSGSGGQASRSEQEKLGMSQMFGSLRRSRIVDSDEDDDETSAKLPDGTGTADDQSSEPQQDASSPQVDGQPSGADSSMTIDPPTPASPPAGRPIQSAASLTASLPPHLAALRAGRAPPGTQDAQRKALEDSREKNRIAMERLRGRMGMGGGTTSAAGGGEPGAGAGAVPPSSDGEAQAEHKRGAADGASPSASTSQQGQGQGQGQSQSQSQNRRAILHSPACTSYFLEPLDWMYASGSGSSPPSSTSTSTSKKDPPSSTTSNSATKSKGDSTGSVATNSSLSSGHLSGKLLCPNAPRCGAKLGNWDWAGMQCGCGAWITPAFAVARGRIDEVWD
ncbi:hypothetical protein BCV69DRAFT_280149 [Microstroma glucosiphilum]|uniref:protein-tyrosine-phosphatase n=1 Tax=Pseudomicrostroma glucosiphilum TaxID=1684307 RepID=A0A316UG86_9BASI|nr:hypothetical protein BCV69DRAFT_280149 [Pseudomicrostroma glucosiphilum]PWN24259.1 hypothetical protein BCV69DRAFT_280149 [Pseudomicrostroma glucosiphilum]